MRLLLTCLALSLLLAVCRLRDRGDSKTSAPTFAVGATVTTSPDGPQATDAVPVTNSPPPQADQPRHQVPLAFGVDCGAVGIMMISGPSPADA